MNVAAQLEIRAHYFMPFHPNPPLATKFKNYISRDQEKQHHTVTIGRLQELTDSVPVLNQDLKINWKLFLTLLTKNAIPYDYFTDNTQISTAGLNFLYEILMLIDATPQRVVGKSSKWIR